MSASSGKTKHLILEPLSRIRMEKLQSAKNKEK
jgi:hypothetical protein